MNPRILSDDTSAIGQFTGMRGPKQAKILLPDAEIQAKILLKI